MLDMRSVKLAKLLERCCKMKDLVMGRHLHAAFVHNNSPIVTSLNDHFIRMFTYCGSLLEASIVFCSVPIPSIYTWQAIISAHVHLGHSDKALGLYNAMKNEQIEPNIHLLQCMLQASGYLMYIVLGRYIHNEIMKNIIELDVITGSSIIDMYGRCGCLSEAYSVFTKMPRKNIVSWSAMMNACVKLDNGHQALELYKRMQGAGIQPDSAAFLSILKACAVTRAIDRGRLIHDRLIRSELNLSSVLGSSLVDMYAKCGSLDEARNVFQKLCCKDIVCWGALISGFTQQGAGDAALELYVTMQKEHIKPTKTIFPCVLNACSSVVNIVQGKSIHCQIVRSGYVIDSLISVALIDMYASCGCLEEARNVFDRVTDQPVAAWGALMSGYAKYGYMKETFYLFEMMQKKKINPNAYILSCLLCLCGNLKYLIEGKLLHHQVLKGGLETNVVVGSSLVDMYGKCCYNEAAWKVFDGLQTHNLISCGALLSGFAQQGLNDEVIEIYQKMHINGIEPNSIILVSVLSACIDQTASEFGKSIHDKIIRKGFETETIVANALINMYCKWGELEEAERILDRMYGKDSVSWSVMIEAFVENGEERKALDLLWKMLELKFEPNKAALINGLKACGGIYSHFEGRCIHDEIVIAGLEADMTISNALIDFYGKYGNLAEARKAFFQLSTPDVISWTSMISAYVQSDLGLRALELFAQMQLGNVEPNHVTFNVLLRACRDLKAILPGMLVHHHIITLGFEEREHIGNGVLDMYTKCRYLVDAENVFNQLPKPDRVSLDIMRASHVEHGNCSNSLHSVNPMLNNGVFEREDVGITAAELDLTVVRNIIDMCRKNGALVQVEESVHTFLPHNLDLCNITVSAYTCHDHDVLALKFYKSLKQVDFHFDRSMLLNLLKSCSRVAALHEGREIHDQILRCNLESDVVVGTTLLHMYGKCGNINDAYNVFSRLQNRDTLCWSSMVALHAQYDDPELTVRFLEDVQVTGHVPCNSNGMVSISNHDGNYHESTTKSSDINTEHFKSSVTRLSRAGCLEEAENVVRTAPIFEDHIGYLALLSICRTYGNINFGKQCFEHFAKDRM